MKDYHDEITNLANKCAMTEDNIFQEYYCTLCGYNFKYDKRKIRENKKEIKELDRKIQSIQIPKEVFEDEKLKNQALLDRFTVNALSMAVDACELGI